MVKGIALFLWTLLLAFSFSSEAQAPKEHQFAQVAADRDRATIIDLPQQSTFGPTEAPQGFGVRMEISAGKASENSFESEHNSAWYLLRIHCDGLLCLDIVPTDSSNDYDFLLFSNTSLTNEKHSFAQAARTNVRRNDSSQKGITGLRSGYSKPRQGPGPGPVFSQPIDVQNGEEYVLVLDNVYPGGKGHKLKFALWEDLQWRGKVTTEEGKEVPNAFVLLSASRGDTVAFTYTDRQGRYTLKAKRDLCQQYSITVSDSIHMFDQLALEGGICHVDTLRQHRLQRLKKGNVYTLSGINFFNGSTNLMPESLPALRQLLRIMRNNPQLTISIEGHVTYSSAIAPKGSESGILQHLSEDRAKKIYDFLTSHGVAPTRLRTQGFSNRNMKYPNPKSESEHRANRRVEIRVLSEH